MKRIYKGNDLVFNLSVNNIPINMSLIKTIEFKFYTLNSANYIKKTEASVDKDNQIILQWQELEKLEQGVLYYDYKMSLFDDTMIDTTLDSVEKVMTDYYIVTGKDSMDISYESAKWGKIKGDINLLLDLKEILDSKADKTYVDTELSNKPSKREVEIGLNEKTDKKVFNDFTKHVDTELTKKLNESDAVGKKYINEDGSEGGEIFNDYVNNKATGPYSHAEGDYTTASGVASHTEGSGTNAFGINSHAEGTSSCPADQTGINISSANEEIKNKWSSYPFALAKGDSSHVEGEDCLVLGQGSHAEGSQNVIDGSYSHASGCNCKINKCWQNNTDGTLLFTPPTPEEASKYILYKGDTSFVAGNNCTSNGDRAVCFGDISTANPYSFATGVFCKSLGSCSFAAGMQIWSNNCAQASFGTGNTREPTPSITSFDQTKRLFCVGNGQGLGKFSDALKMLGSGETWLAGALHEPQADYAEMFEWFDGNSNNEDRVGYFVTMKEDKIVKATSKDNYILGIVSAAPAIIGDNPNLWHGQYINDEWGRPIYENVEVKYTTYETNEQGERVEVEKTRIDHVRKINPEWDATKPYVDRTQRKEWDAVGLMGKLLVRQDGTLTAGSFCKPNDQGIATKSDTGYYVMKVNNENQALVLFK